MRSAFSLNYGIQIFRAAVFDLKYKLKVDLDCLIVLISLQVLSMKTN